MPEFVNKPHRVCNYNRLGFTGASIGNYKASRGGVKRSKQLVSCELSMVSAFSSVDLPALV